MTEGVDWAYTDFGIFPASKGLNKKASTSPYNKNGRFH